jgi:endonuclease-3
VVLEELLPSELYYPFHLNVIRHGRRVCAARKPQCELCGLASLCDYYARDVAPRASTDPPAGQ